MADEPGKDGSSPTSATRTRKVRPEIQIYRPGMMRKGTDVTTGGPPPNDAKPPSEPPRQKRPSQISVENCRGGARVYDNTNRRRSNDTESVHSCRSTILTATKPQAPRLAREKVIEITAVDRIPEYPQDIREIVKPLTIEAIVHVMLMVKTCADESFSQNSTQSLYDPHQPEGYLGYRSNSNRVQAKHEVIGKEASPIRFKRTDRLSVDAGAETRSVGGDGPPSPSMSYMQLCQSFESIGSFDWSQEVESEYNAKHGSDKETNASASSRQESSEEGNSHDEMPARKFNHGDGSFSNFSMRGILRLPPGLRRGKERVRNDSDRSSIRGSIVEEEYESFEASSGECTPTEESGDEKHWNVRNNKKTPSRVSRTARDVPCTAGYSGGDSDMSKENRGSRLSGRVTIDRTRRENLTTTMDTMPLTTRSTRGILIRNEPRRTYKPPALRAAEKNEAMSVASGDVRNSKEMPPSSSSSNQPRQMSDYPVYHEIANNEGPKMQKASDFLLLHINDSISSLLEKVQQRDLTAAGKVVQLSSDLCDIYYSVMLRDIFFTFAMNLEQHLWKQAFYKPIEVFKSVVNSPKENSRSFREHMMQLLDRGVSFYERLLALYEKELNVDLEKAMLFPFDREENFWDVRLSANTIDSESSKRKTALKSCSRHLISLGDLKRYRTLIEGNEDYSAPKVVYSRSAQLWSSSGHCYNQLAVVAFFSVSLVCMDELS
ncbi:unnamed protein product [Nippostrongylus brasiliensis]|uniref:EST1 domain-containing protein n=1 Tax=Nippostrongylus brasiliensis TaxID=27835 RepID=A0A0N4Y3K3_NIPBR|nr:unnamed protein product [Nippostrongylus brasiliensis]